MTPATDISFSATPADNALMDSPLLSTLSEQRRHAVVYADPLYESMVSFDIHNQRLTIQRNASGTIPLYITIFTKARTVEITSAIKMMSDPSRCLEFPVGKRVVVTLDDPLSFSFLPPVKDLLPDYCLKAKRDYSKSKYQSECDDDVLPHFSAAWICDETQETMMSNNRDIPQQQQQQQQSLFFFTFIDGIAVLEKVVECIESSNVDILPDSILCFLLLCQVREKFPASRKVALPQWTDSVHIRKIAHHYGFSVTLTSPKVTPPKTRGIREFKNGIAQYASQITNYADVERMRRRCAKEKANVTHEMVLYETILERKFPGCCSIMHRLNAVPEQNNLNQFGW